jgi:hypothetical protein
MTSGTFQNNFQLHSLHQVFSDIWYYFLVHNTQVFAKIYLHPRIGLDNHTATYTHMANNDKHATIESDPRHSKEWTENTFLYNTWYNLSPAATRCHCFDPCQHSPVSSQFLWLSRMARYFIQLVSLSKFHKTHSGCTNHFSEIDIHPVVTAD